MQITRDEWIRIGKQITETALGSNIRESPKVERTEFTVSYPYEERGNRKQTAISYAKNLLKGVWKSSFTKHIEEYRAVSERFEALSRSFLLAAILLREDPDWKYNGYSVSEYYMRHISRICDPDDSEYVGTHKYVSDVYGGDDPYRLYQHTVETGILSLGLLISRDEIWNRYSEIEKNRIAAIISGFAGAPVAPQNWQLMNMLSLAFLHFAGYEIDESKMRNLARAVLQDYSGDGWYRDGHSFDYYSVWGYQVFAPMWCVYYGYDHMPEIANEFERLSNCFTTNYEKLFSTNGCMVMWGRSIIYRNAITSAWPANLLLNNHAADPSTAKRISDGVLRQFYIDRSIIENNAIPLGFYGVFSPAVQGYSCSASPLWCAMAFLCLLLPENNPFWHKAEAHCTDDSTRACDTVLNAPGLCLTRLSGGNALIRSGKVLKNRSDRSGKLNYAKLCYDSDYLWDSVMHSQQYVITQLNHNEQNPNLIFWAGYMDGILYRREMFDFSTEKEMQWHNYIDLADISSGLGLIRIDRLTLCRKAKSVKLGSFGFPCKDPEIKSVEKNGLKAIVLRGTDSEGNLRQMAMTIFAGWDELSVEKHEGTNPENRESHVITAETNLADEQSRSKYLVSQVIVKDTDEMFTEKELFPVKNIFFGEDGSSVSMILCDGNERQVSFEGINGRLSV